MGQLTVSISSAARPPTALSREERERLKADVFYWGFKQAQQGFRLTEDDLEREYDRRLEAAEQSYRPSRQRDQAPVHPQAEKGSSLLSRRNALKVIGMGGAQIAAALAAVRLAGPSAGASEAKPPADAAPVEVPANKIDQVKLAAENAGRSLYQPFPGATTTPFANFRDLLFPKPAQAAQKGRIREFTLGVQARTLEIARGVQFAGWTYNGTIPGPVLRVTEGDTVRVALQNQSQHPHTIHFHGVHSASQDGSFEMVPPGGQQVYEFTAEPFGIYPYHCHSDPLDQHIARGLYGAMIIDPPQPRPSAKEMVMVMNGFDLNFDKQNELYSINGLPGYFHENPIQINVGELIRIYLLNMTEFDLVNSFHLHANMFNYIPLGTSLTPTALTDVVHLGIADRGILEFRYKFPGRYMFHAHQTEFTVLGWKAIFNVV